MKIEFDRKKSAEALSSLMRNTVDMGKQAVNSAKTGVNAIAEKSKNDSYLRRLKKYNPLFPEQFTNESFKVPSIIVVVDEVVRRDIDVCEGAMGWMNTENGVEIMYLYNTFVEFSGLHFVPNAVCGTVYHIHPYDRNNYIRADQIFDKAQDERIAELKYIAYSLGAKNCYIKISETSSNAKTTESKTGYSAQYNGASGKASVEQEAMHREEKSFEGWNKTIFEGNDVPQVPELKWFANDDMVLRLVDMRCNRVNAVKADIYELSGSHSATMSTQTAKAMDIAVTKMNGGGVKSSFNARAEQEHQRKLFFSIEF